LENVDSLGVGLLYILELIFLASPVILRIIPVRDKHGKGSICEFHQLLDGLAGTRVTRQPDSHLRQ
jgi:hypothetical protein